MLTIASSEELPRHLRDAGDVFRRHSGTGDHMIRRTIEGDGKPFTFP
jgi:hypothetical protein